jgi:hypothetical protein
MLLADSLLLMCVPRVQYKHVNDIMAFRKMFYLDWTQRRVHHAMHTTGVVNIYHVVKEVKNVTN